jgi:phosphoribosyl-ATP pyrophosphohydrolase/phosphoribosyl-AMP cyclohydrolase
VTGAGIATDDPFIAAVKFDGDGLVPAIAVDADTGVVRMFAFASAEALRATQTTGSATFYSRSRRKLWRKGEESGNTLPVREIRLDCDGDAVLYLCAPIGPTCHTGQLSCFFRRAEPVPEDAAIPTTLIEDGGPADVPGAILSRLAQVIAARRSEPPDKSYVSSLLSKGLPKINAKITEEAREITEALVEGDRAHIAHEAADVIFHLMVGLEAAGVKVEDVLAELRRRFGVGGHAEKASRGAPRG